MKFVLLISGLVWVVCFSGCAPVMETEPPPPPPVEVRPTATPVPLADPTATPVPIPTSTPEPEVAEETFDPENPDWELLYRELYAKHLKEFTPPELGQPITLELEGGRRVQGTLSGLTELEVQLTVGAGMIAYPHTALSPVTRAYLFAPAYADANARAEGSLEYQAWQRRQRQQEFAQAEPTPWPTPHPEELEDDDEDDEEETRMFILGVPKNEGPDGRVEQVEQYILQNAAIPSSLNIKAWGPVQKHKNGYKVRVQYSLESAGGLGTSHEDMMFFMSGRGRVYQRAPVK